jgi:hypothetical protein
VAAKDDFLIDTLLDMGVLSAEQVDPVRAEVDATGEGVLDTLVTRGVIGAAEVAQAKASTFGVEYVALGEM